MSLYVLKFGGSSVATTARIAHVAGIVARFVRDGHRVVVVTSAMQGVTNRLVELTKAFSGTSFNREYDAVVSSGEHVSAGLLAMALNCLGVSAKSLTAWQIPIKASGHYSDARIDSVSASKIFALLEQDTVPVIAGFQGVMENRDVCTIGRGGSDATACAVAKAIDADECLVYTDVDGVYTADPRVVLDARKLEEISYDDMSALASWGAKVLQEKSVQIAKEYAVNLRVVSSFTAGSGTRVTNRTQYISEKCIAGIAYNLDLFAIYFDCRVMETLKALLAPFKTMVKCFHEICLIPKSLRPEIQAILLAKNIDATFDNDIGTVTVVGSSDIELDNADYIKKIISGTNFKTLVMPFQQTLPLVSRLHKEMI